MDDMEAENMIINRLKPLTHLKCVTRSLYNKTEPGTSSHFLNKKGMFKRLLRKKQGSFMRRGTTAHGYQRRDYDMLSPTHKV